MTGVKGVYLVSRYLAKSYSSIGNIFLNICLKVEEAAEALKSEEAINGEAISLREVVEKAAADPVWAKDNPIKISVAKCRC